MLRTLVITGPIYLLIALGYLSVRGGVFSPADMRVLGTFVARFALPALVFSALSSRAIGDVLDLRYLAAYGLGSLALMALAYAFGRRVQGKGVALAGLRAMGVSCSNSGYIGYPIVSQVVGPGPAAATLAMCMVVENLVMIPLGLAFADSADSAGSAGGRRRALLDAARGLVRNPVILAIVAGFAMSLMRWQLPEVPARTVSMIALSSSAISLFVIGGSLVGLQLKGMRRDVAQIALAKLLLHPLAVGLMAWLLLPAEDESLRHAAVLFAASPMLSIFPILAQKYGFQGLSAASLLLATLLSFATISAILAILNGLPA